MGKLMQEYGLTGHDAAFYYRFLDRLLSDCKYFLGAGNRCAKYLWAHDTKKQAALMREIYRALPAAPEWCSMEMICAFDRAMNT